MPPPELEKALRAVPALTDVTSDLQIKNPQVQVQIDQPWGEYFADSTRAVPPVMYAEMVAQAGVNPDLYALRIEMGQPEQGRSTRDMMALSALLDRYAALEKPLSVAAVSVPSRPR